MRKIGATILLAVLYSYAGGVASADECPPKALDEKEKDYRRWVERFAGVVFTGRVTGVRPTLARVRGGARGSGFIMWEATLEVEEIWKGAEVSEIKVWERRYPNWPSRFVKGGRYFVEASEPGIEGLVGHLWIEPCGATGRLAGAAQYLKQLGTGRKPPKKGPL